MRAPVETREGILTLPTYLPAAPDKNPMFLEKRVYQGSNGKVYPLPFTDRISETKTMRDWKALWIENEFIRVLILPELGGRIHAIEDKTNGYDLIYNQHVIKPALVGLAGPWASGGIEFNWPQHHRPATFLPVDFQCETHRDGSQTIWLSDHDPMARMKGMHGVCLYPDKAYVELKVRAYNRTPFTQSFLWWANAAMRSHEGYQSFFPPDVSYVADHARRAMSEYPLCKSFYYGVNYGERGRDGIPQNEQPTQFIPPHCGKTADPLLPNYKPNDLSWYANIPTPCSYMCLGSKEDFVGGYDHFAQAGVVHVADHHIAPGKKQWTWGNHPFGYAWDRNLTELDAKNEFGPYVEIMAGVFTDNQPDFSFLQPGETRAWSQYWYPIQKIGIAHHANLKASVHLEIDAETIRIGVNVTSAMTGALISLEGNNAKLEWTRDLKPGEPCLLEWEQPQKPLPQFGSVLKVSSRDGQEIIRYSPKPRGANAEKPSPATEPAAPKKMSSADQLYVTGLHLDQYRHATRCPTLYWSEALRRDPLDSRCNNAMGVWHMRRGEFSEAEHHFRNAIKRVVERNPNPYDGEPFYNLGLCLRSQIDSGEQPSEQKFDEAYAAFYKSTWNHAWQAAAFHAIAELDCRHKHWEQALEHLERSLVRNVENLRARNLKALVLRKLNRPQEGDAVLCDTLRVDPLDWWARQLNGEKISCDWQTRLDIAHDYARAGFYFEAIALLENAKIKTCDLPDQNVGVVPLIFYTVGWLNQQLGDTRSALQNYEQASKQSPDYCFPSRLEEIAIFESAMRANPRDARAPLYLGNLLYDRRRQPEAIKLWERSAKLDPSYSVVWRNLGIGYFNVMNDSKRARAAYDKAFRANPSDGRLLYERDQLWKRLGESPEKRLREIEKYPELVQQRDDLSIELCALYNRLEQPAKALKIISSRKFQPWEGGEGQALGQHVTTHLALGREALARKDFACARTLFEKALQSPENLGEAKHLLANQSDIYFWLGVACQQLGDKTAAQQYWRAAATFRGDFQEMSVRKFSEMTLFSALSWGHLGQKARMKKLLRDLLAFSIALAKEKAKIDYFATSLPTMLLFDDDLTARQQTKAIFMQAQARLGLGQKAVAQKLLRKVLQREPNHAMAADLLSNIQMFNS
ncbi:MAG: DUF5107 domain-containing protein [Limisphaerales bacterium]